MKAVDLLTVLSLVLFLRKYFVEYWDSMLFCIESCAFTCAPFAKRFWGQFIREKREFNFHGGAFFALKASLKNSSVVLNVLKTSFSPIVFKV